MKELAIHSFRTITSIGYVTFREVVRDKILYNGILLACLLLAVSFFSTKLTYNTQNRILINFGLSAVNVSLSALSVFIGAMLLNREFQRRTAFVVLAKPISRFEFILGKYLGLVIVLTVNSVIIGSAFAGIIAWTGGEINLVLVKGLVLLTLQSWLMGALAFLFGTLSTTSISVIICFGIYFIGNNTSQIKIIAQKMTSAMSQYVLEFLAGFVFPNLENFHLGMKPVYGLPVTNEFMVFAFFYCFLWVAFCLFLSGLLIERREI